MSRPAAKRSGRIWTEEERQKQAERIRSQKPWLKSTGPKTARGKLASSRNATRHGCYGAEFKMICLYLKAQKHYIDTLRMMVKFDLFEDEITVKISGNELNENATKSIQNATERHIKISSFFVISANVGIHNISAPRNDNTPNKKPSRIWRAFQKF